jgi:hypothetical protein
MMPEVKVKKNQDRHERKNEELFHRPHYNLSAEGPVTIPASIPNPMPKCLVSFWATVLQTRHRPMKVKKKAIPFRIGLPFFDDC